MTIEKLFVYGTLRDTDIRRELTGKGYFVAASAMLQGFVMEQLNLDGETYPIIRFTGNPEDTIQGEVLDVDHNDLLAFDVYEGPEYTRERVKLENGMVAWTYCK
jgi:gamma-glutamylcyclotransferase (GGCT)/AIG2-like uncharacterized protein YtfP